MLIALPFEESLGQDTRLAAILHRDARMPARIEDYALIGDCETAALIARDGSIDWLCWPRFDSDACFAALLGTRENGRWLITPCDPEARITRRYRDGTLILETEFETDEGTATLIDFMPPRGSYSDLVRLVVGRRGTIKLHTEFILRFGYGSTVPWVTHLEDDVLRAVAGPDMVALRTRVPLEPKGLTTVAEFSVSEGETIPFTLTYAPSHHPLPPRIDEAQALEDTVYFWPCRPRRRRPPRRPSTTRPCPRRTPPRRATR
jgi:GH15 family glucan-1,4-alpha-glucosidase